MGMRRDYSPMSRRCVARSVAGLLLLMLFTPLAQSADSALELSRPVRSWEFLPVVGTRAGLFGQETGQFEAWVYPLKILRNFHLNFLLADHVIPAESLARTISVRPESATIVYASETFSVQETLFVPVHEPGAVVVFHVNTVEPLEIEAAFERDFQLEWPAAVGGTYINWDARARAFAFGEEQHKYAALVGSPTADGYRIEYGTNYSASNEDSFRLGVTATGADTKLLVIAGSVNGPAEAESTYHQLANSWAALMQDSAVYYRDYLHQTVSVALPDSQLQQAYDWSRVSMLQGLVTNPALGTGLIAGYRTSGTSQRPGFAWFFGRDSMWTSLALNASGDFPATKAALGFLSRYQRADGKIAHEIAQSASLVPWFTNFPYAYASADATPLFIITADDYVTRSGDTALASEMWDSLWKAYQFLYSTYGQEAFPQNFGIGHGWVEGGPLLPVKAEFYQVGLGAAALRALSHLASVAGKSDASASLNKAFGEQKTLLNQQFWSEEQKLFAFALDTNSRRMEIASVLATVPMWFDLLDPDKAQAMIDHLAAPEHETDWGMRILSSHDPRYNPGGYHFGSVWPLFTGWASVGEYRYHRSLPAYSNLRANALLSLNGSLGHTTEVLSGDYNQPLSTASPHQIWSAAMVVSPILVGMMGIQVDASSHHLTFAPHVPADWTFFSLHNVRLGNVALDLTYRKTAEELTLEVKRAGSGDCTLDFSPALSLRAKVLGVDVGRRPVQFRAEDNAADQHVRIQVPLAAETTVVRIRVRNDFGIALASSLPPLGSPSRGLRIISESWGAKHDTLVMEVAGLAGAEYELGLWNGGEVTTVEGAELVKSDAPESKLRIRLPAGDSGAYVRGQVTIRFTQR